MSAANRVQGHAQKNTHNNLFYQIYPRLYLILSTFTTFVKMKKNGHILAVILCFALVVHGQNQKLMRTNESKFKQIDDLLPTPNEYRTASGAPGHKYWQQRADYHIKVQIDDSKQTLSGSEWITYYNNSPDVLNYIWIQLDQNIFSQHSLSNQIKTANEFTELSFQEYQNLLYPKDPGLGYKITTVKIDKTAVKDSPSNAKPAKYIIYDTMMRIDLPEPLKPNEIVKIQIEWNNKINEVRKHGGRGGMEYFEKEDNYIYQISQFYPRVCVYDNVNGWYHKSYLGRGEFNLEFGDFILEITVPADHIVGATGVLQNPKEVLTPTQFERYQKSQTVSEPIFIVTPDEAKQNETSRATTTKTWIFKAQNVRDVAFASSRKFIWDGAMLSFNNRKTHCMSLYPKEGLSLWDKYSTHVVMHTIKVYSRYACEYVYPVCYSVNGAIGGMEYPMISFNGGGRPDPDGTYSERTKYGLISVIIHEVGHNFFPMIISSNERNWTWLDEGFNTFLQFLTEQEWEKNYPSSRGFPDLITEYMKSTDQVPIMTNSESLLQFGNNAYGKTATALNILRETIMGRELFDFAFKTYCERWKFKHPTPADFFRTMEDASGIDLDWFWRGWFFTTDHVDISLESVELHVLKPKDPQIAKEIEKQKDISADRKTNILNHKEGGIKQYYTEQYGDKLKDFYNYYDKYKVYEIDKKEYLDYIKTLTPEEEKLLHQKAYIYHLKFKDIGGLLMPLIIKINYADGSSEIIKKPVEIWLKNEKEVVIEHVSFKEAVSFELDPNYETADADRFNNYYPRKIRTSEFELFKQKYNLWEGFRGNNLMRKYSNEVK
ncbi:MAG: M1 family metallopeptidase [Bacteroidia bacterium]|nr:M1 family metallopeptidase [Bacteroidia bacterium]MDW8345487.1 M1 family metallopeptidase [Bacteroidia bacterium]